MKGDAKMNKVKFAVLFFTALIVCVACEDNFSINKNQLSFANQNMTKYSLAEPSVEDTSASFVTNQATFYSSGNIYSYSDVSVPRMCIKAGSEFPSNPDDFFADAEVREFMTEEEAFGKSSSYSYPEYHLYIVVNDLQPNTTYYYALFCNDGVGKIYSEVKSFKTKDPKAVVPLTPVDLGLSVKWANWNLGAGGETQKGNTYSLPDKTNDIINTQYDIAIKEWGQPWRMPSEQEAQELLNKCSWQFVTKEGVEGYQATGPNGKSIFFPCTNNTKIELWTGTNYFIEHYLGNEYYFRYYTLYLDDDDRIVKNIRWYMGYQKYYNSCSIRAVQNK